MSPQGWGGPAWAVRGSLGQLKPWERDAQLSSSSVPATLDVLFCPLSPSGEPGGKATYHTDSSLNLDPDGLSVSAASALISQRDLGLPLHLIRP